MHLGGTADLLLPSRATSSCHRCRSRAGWRGRQALSGCKKRSNTAAISVNERLTDASRVNNLLAGKQFTATIPIVFAVSADPVELGLVPNLNRPGGNLTGISNLNVQIGPKRLELVRELLPGSTQVAVLINPDHPDIGNSFLRGLEPVAKAMGFQLHIFRASKDDELDLAFSQIADQKMDALLIAPDVFFVTRSEQLAKISLRHAVPTIYTYRPFVAAGGLMTYSSDEDEYYRLVGTYAGRILKGDKPGDLPVHQSIKVELIINLKTAKALGITVPLSLLGRADEVIE